jgi:hypothetical protein
MKPAIILVAFGVTFLCSQGCSRNPTKPDSGNATSGSVAPTVFPTPEAAARDALISLETLVNGSNLTTYGFHSLQEVKDASLGAPEEVMVLPNDALSKLTRTTDVRPLLKQIHRVIYPIVVNGQGLSLITVQQTARGWELAGYGPPKLGANLVDARKAAPDADNSSVAAQPSSRPATFDLRVQTLQFDYLASPATGAGGQQVLYLTPLNGPQQTTASTIKTEKSSTIDAMSKSLASANKYAKSLYRLETTESPGLPPEEGPGKHYAINPDAVSTKRKTAADVLSPLAPAAKEVERQVQEQQGP